jgi:hypothetical protein
MTKNFHILRQENYANNRPVSTQEKLDRVLMDSEWDSLECIETISNHAHCYLPQDHAHYFLTSWSEKTQRDILSHMNVDVVMGRHSVTLGVLWVFHVLLLC